MKNQRAKVYWRGNAARLLFLMGAGLLAGFCNGLLGAGGGIVLALSLSAMLPKDSESVRSVYSNALLVMLPLSVLTLTRYIGGGALEAEAMGINSYSVLIGASLGGVVGGILLGKLRGRGIRRLFALLTLISGIIMITR